jgi:hypothetical protein
VAAIAKVPLGASDPSSQYDGDEIAIADFGRAVGVPGEFDVIVNTRLALA